MIFVASFCGCFLANIIWDIVLQMYNSRVSWKLRLRNDDAIYLAIVFDKYCELKGEGEEDDAAYRKLKKIFDEKGFRFQQHDDYSEKQKSALKLIEDLLDNEVVFIKYAADTHFDAEKLHKLEKDLHSKDKLTNNAEDTVYKILSNKHRKLTLDDLDLAMHWLPELMTPPFKNMDGEEIGKEPYFYSVYRYLAEVNEVIKPSRRRFLKCLKALQIINEGMSIPASIGNSAKYSGDSIYDDVIAAAYNTALANAKREKGLK